MQKNKISSNTRVLLLIIIAVNIFIAIFIAPNLSMYITVSSFLVSLALLVSVIAGLYRAKLRSLTILSFTLLILAIILVLYYRSANL